MRKRSRVKYFQTVTVVPSSFEPDTAEWVRLYIFADPTGSRDVIDNFRDQAQAERYARNLGCVRWDDGEPRIAA